SNVGTIGATYVTSPRLVNEARVSFGDTSVTRQYTLDNFGGATPVSDSLFFPSGLSANNAYWQVNLGFPNGRIYNGHFQTVVMRQVNVVDNTSYTTGNHQLKFGADYRRPMPVTGESNAVSYTFNNVAGLVNNAATSFLRSNGMPAHVYMTNLSLYAQDTWHSTPRLSLTYGLRWELNTPPRNSGPQNGSYIRIQGDYTAGVVSLSSPGAPLWNT